jgi:hypothetical protein
VKHTDHKSAGHLHTTVAGNRVRRLGAAAAGALVVLLPLAAPTANAAKESVDPGSLNPPVPAEFNATCSRTGSHITCNLAFSDPDIADEASGIICDGTELRDSQTRSVVGKRTYDADGNLLQRHFRESFDGTFTNPDTGRVATWTAHDTVIHNLATPGDDTSGTEKVSGSYMRIFVPGAGTVVNDAGTLIFDEATEDLLKESGHHPFVDYFVFGDQSGLEPLCAALD